MSKPVLDAFFFGRALAEVLTEKLEESLSDALSELGKFDAEQRERLRQFAEEVATRAAKDVEQGSQASSSPYGASEMDRSLDLQAAIDELRAEIARLKAELKLYRSQSV